MRQISGSIFQKCHEDWNPKELGAIILNQPVSCADHHGSVRIINSSVYLPAIGGTSKRENIILGLVAPTLTIVGT